MFTKNVHFRCKKIFESFLQTFKSSVLTTIFFGPNSGQTCILANIIICKRNYIAIFYILIKKSEKSAFNVLQNKRLKKFGCHLCQK